MGVNSKMKFDFSKGRECTDNISKVRPGKQKRTANLHKFAFAGSYLSVVLENPVG